MTMNVGDSVTLIAIPPDVKDDQKMQTRTLFERCLGRTFTIMGVDDFESAPFKLARLEVGDLLGEKPVMHTIWVEEQYLRLVKSI